MNNPTIATDQGLSERVGCFSREGIGSVWWCVTLEDFGTGHWLRRHHLISFPHFSNFISLVVFFFSEVSFFSPLFFLGRAARHSVEVNVFVLCVAVSSVVRPSLLFGDFFSRTLSSARSDTHNFESSSKVNIGFAFAISLESLKIYGSWFCFVVEQVECK